MKNINLYISEALVTSKPTGVFDNKYRYHPKTAVELCDAIKAELDAGNNDLNCIDTSAITDMSSVFEYISQIKEYDYIDISNWDTSNVENMTFMFRDCDVFKFDVSGWDVSKVRDMTGMFAGCKDFNNDLSHWNTSSLLFATNMFRGCKAFEGIGIENWDVSKVINMCHMFYASGYNEKTGPLTNWTLRNELYARNIFLGSLLANTYGSTPKIENNKFVKK